MNATIDPRRLERLAKISLAHGGHDKRSDGMCSMEAVSWLAREKHSDAPACACPVITRAVQKLNDRMPQDLRDELLRPLLPRIVGSRAGRDVMVKRGFVAADTAVRVFAPMALEARGKLDLAKLLRELAEVTDRDTAIAARDVAREVRSDADAYAAAAAAACAAAADAACAAADAASAAAYAAAAYAADRRKIFEEGVRMIERMLDVTEPA